MQTSSWRWKFRIWKSKLVSRSDNLWLNFHVYYRCKLFYWKSVNLELERQFLFVFYCVVKSVLKTFQKNNQRYYFCWELWPKIQKRNGVRLPISAVYSLRHRYNDWLEVHSNFQEKNGHLIWFGPEQTIREKGYRLVSGEGTITQ